MTYAQAVREALREELRRDATVMFFGEDVGSYGGVFKVSEGLQAEFGAERVFDTPTSEIAIAGAAIGAALVGARPIAEFEFVDFMTCAMDQVANQAAKLRYLTGGQASLPVVFRATYGAGGNFAAQHSQSLEAWFCHVPGLKVAMPSTPSDAKGLLKAAVRDDDPVVFLEHKMLYRTSGAVPDEADYVIPLGRAEVKRDGDDATVVATGAMVQRALDAAGILAEEGIDVEVVDPRTLVPLDVTTLVSSVKRTGRLVVVQEAPLPGSMAGSIVVAIMDEAFEYLDAPVRVITAPSVPVPYPKHLEQEYLPSVATIAKVVREIMPAPAVS